MRCWRVSGFAVCQSFAHASTHYSMALGQDQGSLLCNEALQKGYARAGSVDFHMAEVW